MKNEFQNYTIEYISGVMSLRKPQEDSLRILKSITTSIKLDKKINLTKALEAVHDMYPICSDFERDFLSLTFALATGVGKTRLMGAFITYLYTNHNIKNFFVVASNTTIYEKLKVELSDPGHEKYVFKGIGCYNNPPHIVVDEDYRTKQLSFFNSDIRIFIYNISKFDKDDVKMKKVNEYLGDSFFKYLSSLDDLVLIMDESHHYRAEKGAAALNELKPILGLELTATPLVKIKSKQIPFKNVVYEYPLSKAIEDGFTRTPYAVTRTDIDFYNFGDEQLDKMMLNDGITCHESIKQKLVVFANEKNKHQVKPFMLVVCKDTDHAQWVKDYISSDEFRGGCYKDKTIVIHSKQSGSETDKNTQLLLEVEKTDNPVEVVIHVNMLKEGWDVNNLYTIVPLRTATSKILREQMVGRGLRLPYGERTGNKEIDAVMLTAHDKFNELIAEAQKGDSIFKAGNIIKAEEIELEEVEYTQIALSDMNVDEDVLDVYKRINIEKNDDVETFIKESIETIKEEVYKNIQNDQPTSKAEDTNKKIVESVKEKIKDNKDLAEVFKKNENPFIEWITEKAEKVQRAAEEKFIPIPKIKITDEGVEEYVFVDFDLDITQFNHVPIQNDLLIQNLEDLHDRERIQGNAIDFEGYNPKKVILEELSQKPEIDYQKSSDIIQKLINQVYDHYMENNDDNELKNIVMMNKKDITQKIYEQMLQHFYYENGFLREEVVGTRNYNLQQYYNFSEKADLFSDNFKGNIKSVLFTGIKKGVFESAKFDSKEGELSFARILETDNDVLNWLRPHPKEFDITYNNGKAYEPDFVVETEDKIYLTEVKRDDMINDPDVIAKKERAIKYCKVVSEWGRANGYKSWDYLFIPSTKIQRNSTFLQLAEKYKEQ